MQELLIGQELQKQLQQQVTIDLTYIFNTYYKRVYNYNYYRTHNQAVAEDLTSITFEKVLSHIQSYKPEKAEFEVWLFTIARNVINDYFRKQKKYPWDSDEMVFETISNGESLDNYVIANEEKTYLVEAIKKLKDRERTLVAYKYGAGLMNKEIANIMGMKEKTISVILYRTLQKLKRELEVEMYD